MSISVNNNPNIQQSVITGEAAAAGMKNPANAIAEIAPIITRENIALVNVPAVVQKAREAVLSAVPELEDAVEALAELADLEALLAEEQNESDEAQAASQKKRVEALRAKFKVAHETSMKKIGEAIEKAKKQEKASLANRILSWLGAIFAVASAVAVTIVTGGAAAGFAIAGAVVAVASLVCSETKLDKLIINAQAESIQKTFGCSKKKAMEASQGLFAGFFCAAGLACSIGGLASSLSSAAQTASAASRVAKMAPGLMKTFANTMNTAGPFISVILGAASTTASATNTAFTYQATIAKADSEDVQEVIKKLQAWLEDSEEDLQAVIEMLMKGAEAVVKMLDSRTDQMNEIIGNIANNNV